MTDPTDDLPTDPDDGPDDATVARMRALLRDEPVEDDELARERRLRNAMGAAQEWGVDTPSGPAPAAVPPPRRAGARPWLVAAAVLALVGIGGYFAVSISGSGSNDESADSAATLEESADATRAPSDATAGADGAPSTTATMDPAPTEATGTVASLGTFDDIDALRSAITDGAADLQAPGAVPRSTGAEDLRCVQQQLALGIEVVGTAVVGATPVVVTRTPAGLEVLDAATCTRLAG